MAYFQHRALQVIPSSYDAVLGPDAGMAHEQEGGFVVGTSKLISFQRAMAS